MSSVRVVLCFILLILVCSFSLRADSFVVKSKRLTVLGMLTDSADDSPSGPASSWCIQLNPVIMLDGKQISALTIKSSDTHKLVALEDKFVQAKGTLTLVLTGTDSAQPPTFELSWIKEHKTKNKPFPIWPWQ